jgi:hypothetical protein
MRRNRWIHGGCDFAAAGNLDATTARPIWDRAVDTSVVTVSTSAATALNAFDIKQVMDLATIVRSCAGHEQLLLSDGLQQLRFDVVQGSLLAGPVALHFNLSNGPTLSAQLNTLRNWQLFRNDRDFGRITKQEKRAPTWVRQLRAFDGAMAGATMREIAQTLFPALATPVTIHDRNSAIRSKVRRLLRSARENVASGYRRILSGNG